MRRSVLRALLALLAVLLPLLALNTAPASAAVGRYVALGDSFTAGPLIPDPTGFPPDCLRSTRAYPRLVAAAIAPSQFVDASCSGADSTDMTNTQDLTLFDNPPQFNALTADTALVTLQIGGNDIGFSGIIETCGELSFSRPFGDPCHDAFNVGGVDQLQQRIAATAPKIAAVLAGIKARSPNARILVVGYLAILPSSIGCFPVVPIAVGDVPWLDGVERSLNSMIATQAAAAGAQYVDVFVRGHDVCRSSGTRWVEGLFPVDAAPFHPNAAGMAFVAQRVVAAVG